MVEKTLVRDFGYRVDVFEVTPPQTLIEKVLRRNHLERTSVRGGKMSKEEALALADELSKAGDGLVYKAVQEVPQDLIIP